MARDVVCPGGALRPAVDGALPAEGQVPHPDHLAIITAAAVSPIVAHGTRNSQMGAQRGLGRVSKCAVIPSTNGKIGFRAVKQHCDTVGAVPAPETRQQVTYPGGDGHEFAHLHLHTEATLMDGEIRPRDLVNRVQELGMKAVAVTDRENVFGAWEVWEAARRHGIKTIFGCEVEVAGPDGRAKTGGHLVLLARDAAGWRNLSALATHVLGHGPDTQVAIGKALLAQHATSRPWWCPASTEPERHEPRPIRRCRGRAGAGPLRGAAIQARQGCVVATRTRRRAALRVRARVMVCASSKTMLSHRVTCRLSLACTDPTRTKMEDVLARNRHG